jgi:anti-anti-sigma regulatory factor
MEPSVIVIVIDGPVQRVDIPVLCERFGALLRDGRPAGVVCDVAGVTSPDAVVADTLARLQLQARRVGLQMHLSRASPALVELLSLTGLLDVLPLAPALGVETGGKAEQRKQRCRIQEERDPGNPAA